MSGHIFAPSEGTASAPLYPPIIATFHLDPSGRYFASASLHHAESGKEVRAGTLAGSTTTTGYQLNPRVSPWEWSFTLEDTYITRPGAYLVNVTAMRIRDEGAEYQAQVTSGVVTIIG